MYVKSIRGSAAFFILRKMKGAGSLGKDRYGNEKESFL